MDEGLHDSAATEQVPATAPGTPLAGRIRPEMILGALGRLERAMTAHTEWLKDWHQRVFCGDPQAASADAVDTAGRCPLGDWYHGRQHRAMADNPVFARVGDKLDDLYGRAHAIEDVARQGRDIPSGDYGTFMTVVLELNTLIRQLEKDTWNRLANIDPLTGIGNRQAMRTHLEIENERNWRSGRPCCIALVDLDYFKRVNDTYGHAAGDMVLQVVATVLADCVRPYDRAFRYGGEEFVLCLPDTDTATAEAVVDRVRQKIADTVASPSEGQVIRVTASFGVAPLTQEGGIDLALGHADAAMYEAKGQGRNRVCVWRPAAN